MAETYLKLEIKPSSMVELSFEAPTFNLLACPFKLASKFQREKEGKWCTGEGEKEGC